jgi:hypothetical protein
MKNITFYLLMILVMNLSCSDKTESNHVKQNDCSDMLDLEKWRKEILNLDSILINGTVPIISTRRAILKIFGEPDKITKINPNEGFLPYLSEASTNYEAFSLIYGGTSFDEIGGSVILNTIDFNSTDKIELMHPKITLKKGMSINKIKEIYPELIINSGNAWSGHIELKTSNYPLDPRRWFLIFRVEQLEKIVLYTFSRR